MPRRTWLIVALLLIAFLAAIGAVLEFAGHWLDGGSFVPLLAWIVLWPASLILVIAQTRGMPDDTHQDAGVNEVVDSLSIGVALYDSAGKLRRCNEAFRQFFPDPAVHGDAAELAAALHGTVEQPKEINGDHELAAGRWLRLDRRELAGGGCVITALDISRIAALEEDFLTTAADFQSFLSAVADWTWETDVLHRFALIRPVDADGHNREFDYLIGRNLAELAGGEGDANSLAAQGYMRDMDRRAALRDVRLTLYTGRKAIAVRLGGMPQHDAAGEFLGYRGVGVQEDSPPPAASVAEETETGTDRPAGRLLLVDDSSENRILAKSILNKMGYAVDEVDDALKAVEAVRTGNYSAVLMDVRMPGMDGFEATTAIRQLPSPKGDLPIIAMTAHTGEEERRRCLGAGMDEHTGKPIDRRKLAAVLRRLAGPPPGQDAPDENPDGAAPRDATSLVNDGVLEELRNDAGPALVAELIAAYMAETGERLGRIEAAVTAGDMEAIATDTHSMKSSSGTFGALPLQALSARLESAAMQGDAAAVAAAQAELPQLVSETWREFAARGYQPD